MIVTTRINTHTHFCDLTEEFDDLYGTNTYMGFASLKDINKYFPLWENRARDDALQIHEKINLNIGRGFIAHKRTEFTNQDYLPRVGNVYELYFFNGIYLLLNGIINGEGLYGPVAVSRFSNKRTLLHPGSHRITLMNTYKDEVTFFLTDYNKKDLTTGKWFGKLYKPRDEYFDWRQGRWVLRDMPYSELFQKSHNKEKRYRDIVDGNVDDDLNSWHKPELANRTYTLKDNKVYVDDMPVCEFKDGLWKIVDV